jgi:hypothetical protein
LGGHPRDHRDGPLPALRCGRVGCLDERCLRRDREAEFGGVALVGQEFLQAQPQPPALRIRQIRIGPAQERVDTLGGRRERLVQRSEFLLRPIGIVGRVDRGRRHDGVLDGAGEIVRPQRHHPDRFDTHPMLALARNLNGRESGHADRAEGEKADQGTKLGAEGEPH